MPSMAELRTKVLAGAGAALGTVASVVVVVVDKLSVLQPLAWYVGKAFHLGFIPLVIVLGMRPSAGSWPQTVTVTPPLACPAPRAPAVAACGTEAARRGRL